MQIIVLFKKKKFFILKHVLHVMLLIESDLKHLVLPMYLNKLDLQEPQRMIHYSDTILETFPDLV